MTIKEYFRLAVTAIIIGLALWAFVATKAAKNSRNDAQRYYENLLASSFEVQKLQTKTGELQYKVSGMNLERDEFEEISDSLAQRVKDLAIKLKKAESVVHIVTEYSVRIDTFYIDTVSPIKSFSYSDKWVAIKGFFNNSDKYLIDSLNLRVTDDVIIVPTVEGKWWQCRKKWKIAVRMQSKNPYNEVDRLEYFKFVKR